MSAGVIPSHRRKRPAARDLRVGVASGVFLRAGVRRSGFLSRRIRIPPDQIMPGAIVIEILNRGLTGQGGGG